MRDYRASGLLLGQKTDNLVCCISRINCHFALLENAPCVGREAWEWRPGIENRVLIFFLG